ncbi:hypothetical protein ACJX0J_035365, partial [Zea mays]
LLAIGKLTLFEEVWWKPIRLLLPASLIFGLMQQSTLLNLGYMFDWTIHLHYIYGDYGFHVTLHLTGNSESVVVGNIAFGTRQIWHNSSFLQLLEPMNKRVWDEETLQYNHIALNDKYYFYYIILFEIEGVEFCIL